MAVKSEHRRAIGANPNTVVDEDTWVRPSDWLALPTPTTHQMVGLFAVYNDDTQFLAFTATSTGGYTVDWGDGTIDNWASTTVASHTYNYSTLSSPVSSRGYKMAIVKVYPQSSTLTQLTLRQVNHPSRVSSNYSYNWLDIWLNTPSLTDLGLGSTAQQSSPKMLEQVRVDAWALTNFSNLFYFCNSLQSVILANSSGTVTSCQSMFNGCVSLKTAPLFNTANVLSFATMFNNCYSLRSVSLYNTSSGTSFSGMFQSCYSLKTVPLFNAANITTMANMFNTCTSLKTVPLFNTANVTSMTSMFSACIALETVPLFNTANVTDMSSMFNGCTSFRLVPLFNTVKVTNMGSMFASCTSLQSTPSFDCTALTNAGSMFVACNAINSIGTLNFNKVINGAYFAGVFTSDFQLSSADITMPPFPQSLLNLKFSTTALNSIFTNLVANPSPATITSATGTGTVQTYTTSSPHGFYQNSRVTITGLTPAGYNVTNVNITTVPTTTSFTTPGATTTASSGTGTATIVNPVITVTGNPGAATCTTSIATTKGWTVTI